jgi:hypothetical protein
MSLALSTCRRLLLAGMLLPFPTLAQSPAVLPLPDGGVVEVIGLRRWTVQMLQDSLARHAPGTTLQSHACAAALRYKLGFADASAVRHVRNGVVQRVVVTVREPQDSALVRYRPMPLERALGRTEWHPVSALFLDRPRAFHIALRLYTAIPGQMDLDHGTGEDSVAAAAALEFLKSRTTEDDRRAAHEALATSPYFAERIAAALILGNFADRDDTYWSLIDAMRESDGPVKQIAGDVLDAVSETAPRKVDWGPAAEGVHAMLNGTSVVTLPKLVRILSRTGVDSSHAKAFLRGGGDMLLAYVASETDMLSRSARTLLVQLRGEDLGPSPAAWRTWIEGLSFEPTSR